jgi:hypothetical protein
MSALKNNLGYKVRTQSLDWNQMVRASWGAEFSAPDHGAYEFSNGRKFDSTDRGTLGIYGISGINYLMVGDGKYPDMPSNDHMLQLNLSKIELE